MSLPESQIIVLVGAAVGLIGAFAYAIRSIAAAREKDAQTRFLDAQTRQKNAEAEALREKAEVDTNQKVFGTITDTIASERTEKAQLKADLRLATEQRDTATINWQNAQTMIESKNERIATLEGEKRALQIELENTRHRLEHCLDKDDDALSDFNDLADTQRIEP